jgi:hypothetical protein
MGSCALCLITPSKLVAGQVAHLSEIKQASISNDIAIITDLSLANEAVSAGYITESDFVTVAPHSERKLKQPVALFAGTSPTVSQTRSFLTDIESGNYKGALKEYDIVIALPA